MPLYLWHRRAVVSKIQHLNLGVRVLYSAPRQTTVGPTALNFLMTYKYAGGVPYKAATLAFWAGLIEILAGLCNLGFLIQFVSGPVMSAFASVISILVKLRESSCNFNNDSSIL